MFQLTRRNRSLCAVCGAIATGSAFGLLPICARSSVQPPAEAPAASLVAESAALFHERSGELPAIDDPFARPLPDLPAAQAAAKPAHRKAAAGPGRIALRALALGSRSHALIDDGTTMRIVAPGDSVLGRRVLSIDARGLLLAGGRRLTLADTP